MIRAFALDVDGMLAGSVGGSCDVLDRGIKR